MNYEIHFTKDHIGTLVTCASPLGVAEYEGEVSINVSHENAR
jgi:hypothetical protein